MLKISAKFTVLIVFIFKVSDIVKDRYSLTVRVSVKFWPTVIVR